jgi:hypothetical protein
MKDEVLGSIVETSDLSSTQPASNRRLANYFQGWRTGVSYGLIGTIFVCLLNTFVLIWANVSLDAEHGIAILLNGDCHRVGNISTGTHLAINALGSLLVAASNSCMQCLTAPTRPEVDWVHAKRKTLDVGVQSLRNLKHIDRRRLYTWMFLVPSSIALHLLYVGQALSLLFSTRPAS